MVDQEIIDLPNDDAQPSDPGLFIPLQKDIADTRRRSLNNIIPLMQTPWLQTIDGNNQNLDNLNKITTKVIHNITPGFPNPISQNTAGGVTAVINRHDYLGPPSIAQPSGQHYGRTSIISQSNTDGDESARMNLLVVSNGSLLVGLEIDGLNQEVIIKNGFDFNLETSAIINAGSLNTHIIPGGTDTLALLLATQTLENKTLLLPVIADFTNAIHNHTDDAGGGQLVASTALDATGTPGATTFLRGDNAWVIPPGTPQTPWEQNIDAANFNLNDVNQVNAKFLSITASDLNIPFLEATHNNPINGSILFRNEANTGTHVYTKMDIIAASITPDSEESRTEWHESTLGVLLLAMELRGDTKTLKMNNDYDIDLDTSNLINVHTITIQHIRNIEGGFVNPISQNELNGPTSTIYRHDFLGAPSTAQSNGQLYGRMSIISQDNVDGAEYAKMNLDVVKNGALEVALEIDGENSQIKLFNNFELNLDNNNIQNAVLVAPDIADYTNAAHNHEDAASGGKLDTLFTWAATDEDSPLPGGVFPVLYITEPADKDRTITDVIAGLKNAATGSLIGIEIQKETAVNSNSFTLAAALEIDIDEFTSTTATTSRIITVPGWERGRRLKIILLQNDTNFAATGLKVTIVA